MAEILRRILADKRAEVARRRQKTETAKIRALAAAAPPPRSFTAALLDATAHNKFPLIAEIKYKSPSRGILRPDFNPAKLAADYENGGAACLSVLTDSPYFGGENTHLQSARAACDLPVLRKDFIVDEWQIYESRALGADAILLLAAACDLDEMRHFAQTAATLGMAVLAESHTASELQSALQVPEVWLGINSRNLGDFNVSLQTSLDLLPQTAGRNAVAESGISTAADVAALSQAGANAFLIGETLMRAPAPAPAIRKLFSPAEK